MQDAGLAPFPDCDSERVAQMAGILSAAVMAREVSLSDFRACVSIILAAMGASIGQDLLDAHAVVIRMVEDRARRATDFTESRR